MSLCHLFLLSFSLRRLLIPSYLTMSERHCDIHWTYHPKHLGISITTPRLSLIYFYLSVASSLNSPWAADVSLLKTCMALNFKKGARFRQALGSTNRPLYPGREWRLLGQHWTVFLSRPPFVHNPYFRLHPPSFSCHIRTDFVRLKPKIQPNVVPSRSH